ncbi:MAG: hypothetical protein ACRDOU_26660 [Streptosporangiaceae bacterium]
MSYAPHWIMRGHRGLFCQADGLAADGAEMAGFLALLVGLAVDEGLVRVKVN